VRRGRTIGSIALLGLFTVGISWGALSASAASQDPTPVATAPGNVSFSVDGTDSPSPSPSPSSGSTSGSGGSTGSSSSGSGSGGQSSTPAGGASASAGSTTVCVPTTTTPVLADAPATGPTALKVSAKTLAQGSDVIVTGQGFQVGEKVVIALYPNPIKLGVATVRTNGEAYADVTIPMKTQLGEHSIQVLGFQDCRAAAATVSVVSPRGSGSSVFPWVVWFVAGGAVGVAAIGLLIAALLGWLPKAVTVGVAAAKVAS
jgi:hypothetical protein